MQKLCCVRTRQHSLPVWIILSQSHHRISTNSQPFSVGIVSQRKSTKQRNNHRNNNSTRTLPTVIQDLMERGVGTMDVEEIGVASAAAPMVDDDNKPAPENHPSNGETVDDIFSGWTHSGICERKALISRNTKAELSFWTNKSVEPSNLQIWEGLFFTSFIKRVILPQTNNNLPAGEKHIQYGEFLHWLGLWVLMGTLIGPQRYEFWATHTINAFHGAPL